MVNFVNWLFYWWCQTHSPDFKTGFIFFWGPLKLSKAQISVLISWPFLYYDKCPLFSMKNWLQKSDVLRFGNQVRHEVVGLETKFFCLHLAQLQLQLHICTSLSNLRDKELRYKHFCDQFLWCKLLDTFSCCETNYMYAIQLQDIASCFILYYLLSDMNYYPIFIIFISFIYCRTCK